MTTLAGVGQTARDDDVPTGFTVSGSADSQVKVAQVLDRLALLPWLSNITLQASVRSGEVTTPIDFTIAATLVSEGGRR